MNDKLRADLIGARVCGWDGYVTLNDMDTLKLRRCEPERPRGSTFSISNKAYRMDVVESLGYRHGIYIEWDAGMWYPAGFDYEGEGFMSHEEATRAALLTLADEYLRG